MQVSTKKSALRFTFEFMAWCNDRQLCWFARDGCDVFHGTREQYVDAVRIGTSAPGQIGAPAAFTVDIGRKLAQQLGGVILPALILANRDHKARLAVAFTGKYRHAANFVGDADRFVAQILGAAIDAAATNGSPPARVTTRPLVSILVTGLRTPPFWESPLQMS
jgi:hypothetical protein